MDAAIHRGRLIRREFRPLLEFNREQVVFLQHSRQRQKNILRQEIELEFLRSTSAQDLSEIGTARKITCARKIQKQWRRYRLRGKRNVADPVTREFDPFGFQALTHETRALLEANLLAKDADELDSLWIKEQDQCFPRETMLSEAIDAVRRSQAPNEDFMAQRERVEKRIKELAETRDPSSAKAYTRRELHDEIKSLTQTVNEKLADYKKHYGNSQQERAVHAELLQRSCSSRLKALTSLSTSDRKMTQDFIDNLSDDLSTTEDWSLERKYAAYSTHMNTVNCISIERENRKWFETFIAGKEYNVYHYLQPEKDAESYVWRQADIEDHVEPNSQFVFEKRPVENTSESLSDDDELAAISRFINPEFDQETKQDAGDIDASQLWKAFCTNQVPHCNAFASEGPHIDESSFSIAPEMVVHPVLYDWYSKSLALKREEGIKASIAHDRNLHHRDVCKKINEIETAVSNNTKEIERLACQQEVRKQVKGRQQTAVSIIQRVARGYAGRKQAKEIEHKYFKRIRGRLIRLGKCEECGNAAAVLRCDECEECTLFCPSCWVYSHQTPQRQEHIAIPMVIQTDPK
uniref:Uncharacterized protein AlNc14C193G8505 n=1 Tax=Albugo laibachii Nc14 TaxID=890382 RepID=F0WQ23_9STRA|nr:hypothetical protein PITG_06344 [Albugo laibachii Nc14]|eukprot:CCA23428.1 hypothetical protein PITG_06344 [Albugo laibachii Nc14]